MELRAFRLAQLATGNTEDALDIVQEAMFKLASKYGSRPQQEWGPLFQRILQSRINDWHRRTMVRNRFRIWLGTTEDDGDVYQNVFDDSARTPEQLLQADRRLMMLEQLILELPMRQRQAFLLRCLEGLDIAQTALTMGCSQGSVKTHYSRAVHFLREKLGEEWP